MISLIIVGVRTKRKNKQRRWGVPSPTECPSPPDEAESVQTHRSHLPRRQIAASAGNASMGDKSLARNKLDKYWHDESCKLDWIMLKYNTQFQQCLLRDRGYVQHIPAWDIIVYHNQTSKLQFAIVTKCLKSLTYRFCVLWLLIHVLFFLFAGDSPLWGAASPHPAPPLRRLPRPSAPPVATIPAWHHRRLRTAENVAPPPAPSTLVEPDCLSGRYVINVSFQCEIMNEMFLWLIVVSILMCNFVTCNGHTPRPSVSFCNTVYVWWGAHALHCNCVISR